MRLEFQLTFDEFHEALTILRRRLMLQVRRRFRLTFWIGVIIGFVVVEVALKAVSRIIVTPAGYNPLAQPWQESLRPYVSFLVGSWIVIFGLLLAFRRRATLLERAMWEGRAQWQQVFTAQLD